MDEITVKWNRVCMRWALVGCAYMAIIMGLGLTDALLDWRYHFDAFLDSPWFKFGHTGLFFLIYLIYSQTKFFKVNRNLGFAQRVINRFNRAERTIQSGFYWESPARVERGLKKLRKLQESCSDVPEYQELLRKGQEWLNEKGKRNA
jgi:hypothetical protein